MAHFYASNFVNRLFLQRSQNIKQKRRLKLFRRRFLLNRLTNPGTSLLSPSFLSPYASVCPSRCR
ncbi:hypothetical protein FKR43_08090 [Neisseria meningitidis]|nr:hypothetical protein [Neisseria meningitidis]